MDIVQDVTAAQEIRIRLFFRQTDSGRDAQEYQGETVSISDQTFVMRSPIPLQSDSVLGLRMRVPVEISGSPFQEMRGTGRVLCECRLKDGTTAYRVLID
jgi:hypothetical protein